MALLIDKSTCESDVDTAGEQTQELTMAKFIPDGMMAITMPELMGSFSNSSCEVAA